MITICKNDACVKIDYQAGKLATLSYHGRELLAEEAFPLFAFRLRTPKNEVLLRTALDAEKVTETENGAYYEEFPEKLRVHIWTTSEEYFLEWHIEIENETDAMIEWAECGNVLMGGKLSGNGGDAKILYPYNEGALVDDMNLRDASWFPHMEPEYPSYGKYSIFPNMICSQFLAYLFAGNGLYIGAHDEARGVKGIDFYGEGNGIKMNIRLFAGVEYGADYRCDFPIVWDFFRGEWEDGAEIYRKWFDAHPVEGMKKLNEKHDLPKWYENLPLSVIYPVRGVHDMDNMVPNELFPYANAMPMIRDIAAKTGSQILALVMHWEGTAPWAPPFVWPPYGGEEVFYQFRDMLHQEGHLLGVYCSGIGWTKQSNLIASYNTEKEFAEKHLEEAMCTAPDGSLPESTICTGQRHGYDLCPATKKAQDILHRAYEPLMASGIDYAQILDQNHGGGAYFCYGKDHGHPPAPGPWMTKTMQSLLGGWNAMNEQTLLGCESASAEAFLPHLRYSDNRYELNYLIGMPVPMYAYIYHEYLHNFMGNQVCCQFEPIADTMCYRLAYSFVAGDCMSLVVSPNGELLANWGTRDFEHRPDKANTLEFIANMTKFYKEQAKPYLYNGRMLKPLAIECAEVTYPFMERDITVPCVLTSAWCADDGSKVQILVNHTKEAQTVRLADGRSVVIPEKNAVLVPLA